MLNNTLFATLATLALLSTPALALAESAVADSSRRCTTTAECGCSEVCVSETCQYSPATPMGRVCASDTECMPDCFDLRCIAGVCATPPRRTCARHGDCECEEACIANECVRSPGFDPSFESCSTGADCHARCTGLVCRMGVCTVPRPGDDAGSDVVSGEDAGSDVAASREDGGFDAGSREDARLDGAADGAARDGAAADGGTLGAGGGCNGCSVGSQSRSRAGGTASFFAGLGAALAARGRGRRSKRAA